MRGYRYIEKSRPGVDLRHVDPTLLAVVNEVGRRLRQKVTVFSGYRTDDYSARVGGFRGDPHTRHIAVDAEINGTPFTRYPGVAPLLRAFGIVSGDQPNFYHGQPDPEHVQLRDENAGHYDYTECMALWLRAGGPPAVAPVAAAIALAESAGNPRAHNTSGEDSRGLWQINVAPSANPQYRNRNLFDPMTNARTAVAIYKSWSRTFNAWSTYTNGAYRNMGPDSQPVAPPGRTPPPPPRPPRPGPNGDQGTGIQDNIAYIYDPRNLPGDALHGAEHAASEAAGKIWSVVTGAKDATWGVAKAVASIAQTFVVIVGFIVNPRNWLRLVELLVGLWLLFKALDYIGASSPGSPLAKAQRKGRRTARRLGGPEMTALGGNSSKSSKKKTSKTRTVATAAVTRGRAK